jgi:Protein of unknown function (DUF616)
MLDAKVVVYTAVTNDYDNLLAPTIKVPGWSYICFTDDTYTEKTGWEVRPLQQNGLDPVRLSRLPKILAHCFLLDYDVSIWIDANIEITGNLQEFCALALAQANIAFFCHGYGNRSVAAEIFALFWYGKARLRSMFPQYLRYRAKGFPDNAGVIPEGGIIVRRHHDPCVRAAMEQWWFEFLRYTPRDQISLPYIIWRNSMNATMLNWDLRKSPWFTYHDHKA